MLAITDTIKEASVFLSISTVLLRVLRVLEPIPTKGKKQNTPMTDGQIISGLTSIDKQSFTTSVNLESQINLTACRWTVGGNRSTWINPCRQTPQRKASSQNGFTLGHSLAVRAAVLPSTMVLWHQSNMHSILV